jgi:hypothetical protein
MNRELHSWNRVVVCSEHSTVTVFGQSGDRSKSLKINRVKHDIVETGSEDIGRFGSVVAGSGLIGFLELKGGTYLGVVSKTSEEGRIGVDHKIYSIQEIVWVPVSFGLHAPTKHDSKHLQLVSNLLKTGDFFFSPTLDLDGGSERFVWNSLHNKPSLHVSPEFRINIIHGGFRALSFSSVGRAFQFILIARRSRFFAGTRYRKRGLNWDGDCANEVETEQIFIQIGPPDYVYRFKQVRGSVPLHWAQDLHNILGKPEITVKNTDLELDSTKRHFLSLLQRYREPIVPVSLLLSREGSGEAALGAEYADSLKRLGIKGVEPLKCFDLKLSAHSETSAAMFLDASPLVTRLIAKTGWTAQNNFEIVKEQKGIIRTNCVDCLDRTSIFQYMVGLEVLNQQLIELGVLASDSRLKPTWAGGSGTLLKQIEHIFDSVSDPLALQYAGTAAHKKYSSGSQSTSFESGLISSGRELFISLSRHYSSTFTDNDKQNAMNLFLGIYKNFWDKVATDEDILAVDGLDRFVHAIASDGHGEEKANPCPAPLVIQFPLTTGCQHLRMHADFRPLLFHSPPPRFMP